MRRSIPLVLAFTLLACAHAPRREAQFAGWENRHPEAAAELGDWTRRHPAFAHELFEWDAQHPKGARALVGWALEHPAQPIEGFIAMHLGRREFDEMLERHRPGSEQFLAWARRHPRASEDLVSHPGGLAWAGNHLYR